MSSCESCGGELSALGSPNHLSCEDCGDVFWLNDDGSFDKDDDFDSEQFADNAIGGSEWRSDE